VTSADSSAEPRPLTPIANGASLGDEVAERLREAIDSGQFAGGTHLVERRLADQLGVSHVPVREALARLETEGLVERLPRRGTRVAVMTQKDLDDLSELRAVLESYVLERAQQRWNERDERALRRVVEQMREAAEKGNTERLFALDVRFHEQLWAMTDSRPLQELVARLRARINRFLRAATSTLDPAGLTDHADKHGELLDAIASGDPDRARAAMVEHVQVARARIETSLE
jgi:DNA-binding GntR family transcriptional regulator